tara:strand:- start:8154 stop:8303 length:150 start_codon:yes stop_codon:yes gene_type:complete
MKHYLNEGKEYLKKSEENFDEKRYEKSMKLVLISYAGLIITFILILLFN